MQILKIFNSFFCWLILISFQTTAFSQDTFKAGFLFGANGIQFQGDVINFWSPVNGKIWGEGGLSTGFFVNTNLHGNSSINMELRYIRKGSLYEFIDNFNTASYESVKLQYVEIPLLYGYRYKTSIHTFCIETGCAYARLFSSQIIYDKLQVRDKTPLATKFRNYDVSWILALKFPIQVLKNEKLALGFRFSHSLISIHKLYNLYNMDYGIEVNYYF